MVFEKNNYEIAATLKGEATDGVKTVLKKHGAVIVSEADIVKVRMAYPIKKEMIGFFSVIRFTADPAVVSRISADLFLVQDILRFFISKISLKEEATGRTASAKRPRLLSRKPIARKPGTEILSNEDLEKKIEEILK